MVFFKPEQGPLILVDLLDHVDLLVVRGVTSFT